MGLLLFLLWVIVLPQLGTVDEGPSSQLSIYSCFAFSREDNFVQHVIKAVVENRIEDSPGNHLTYQDIFFREVRLYLNYPFLCFHFNTLYLASECKF